MLKCGSCLCLAWLQIQCRGYAVTAGQNSATIAALYALQQFIRGMTPVCSKLGLRVCRISGLMQAAALTAGCGGAAAGAAAAPTADVQQ